MPTSSPPFARSCIFIPSDLEPAKIVGAAIYAPTLIAVEGNYDDVNRLSSEIELLRGQVTALQGLREDDEPARAE